MREDENINNNKAQVKMTTQVLVPQKYNVLGI